MARRETRSSDWKVIDQFFQKAHQAYKDGEMTEAQFRHWITHFIGVANNEGIDNVLEGIKNATAEVDKTGWGE